MRYLTKVTEEYRLPNEETVKTFIEELRKEPHFTVQKYSSTKKCKKSKGEIEDEWILFKVTKLFNDEKEPDSIINISYNRQDIGGEMIDED